MNTKYLGQRLRQFRKDAHLTQNQLAKKAGITPTYLSIIERGAQLPRLETFINLANVRFRGRPSDGGSNGVSEKFVSFFLCSV